MVPENELVEAIEKLTGARLPLPDVHPEYYGLKVNDGLITDRVLSAYYSAYQATRLAGKGSRLLEIGGGMGYVAYYCFLMGCKAYTIVDLPLTGFCQGYFLMRVLGPDQVVLQGETTSNGGGAVRLLSPIDVSRALPVDLAINIDGLTEYGLATAKDYLAQIRRLSPALLSINHEANPYRVHDLLGELDQLRSYQRHPSWLRRGYVEEVVRF